MAKTASCKVTITNKLGLHARPAMMFVQKASEYLSSITVCRAEGDEVLDGKSIMSMMMLAATRGTEIVICADGEDAEAAVTDLETLVRSNFSEDE